MDYITRDELQTLVESGSEPRVSIYVKQQAAYPASDENAMQLRHALFQAATKLIADGYDKNLVDSLLQPGVEFVRNGKLSQTTGSHGLAVLFAPGVFQHWQLPFDCEPAVDIGAEFRIAPLVQLLNWPQETRVLALSGAGAKFFRCTRDAIQELDLPLGTPANLDDFEWGPDVGRAVRFQTNAGATGATHQVHGQTSFKDEQETRVQAYVRTIARNIGKLISHEKLPLVLFAAQELHPVFNAAYPAVDHLMPGIQGSPAHLSATEIQRQVVELVDKYGNRELRAAREQYQSALERHHASSVVEDIVPAAIEGRVDTLVVAAGERAWGFWDNLNKCALACTTAQPLSVDLIELAIHETLRHGGRVCVAPRPDVPEQARCVAALRWREAAESTSARVGIKNEL